MTERRKRGTCYPDPFIRGININAYTDQVETQSTNQREFGAGTLEHANFCRLITSYMDQAKSCIRQVFGSIVGRDTNKTDCGVRGFAVLPGKFRNNTLKLGHNHIIP